MLRFWLIGGAGGNAKGGSAMAGGAGGGGGGAGRAYAKALNETIGVNIVGGAG